MSTYGEGNPLLETFFREMAKREGQEAADKLREEMERVVTNPGHYRPPWIDPPEMPDREDPKVNSDRKVSR